MMPWHRFGAIRWLAAPASVMCLSGAPAPAATVRTGPDVATWSAAAEFGQSLYYGTRGFERQPRVAGAALPMVDAACVRCHGALGEGGRESNLAAPALRVRGVASGAEQAASGNPWNGPALVEALTHGTGAGGRVLSQVMPLYLLSMAEREALQSFIPWLGRADAPVRGVADEELRLGLALDGINSIEARTQVEAGVRAVMQQVNEAGGVHGRQLRLLRVSEAGADVLALVGSAPSAALRSRLTAERLPSLASLALEIEDVDPNDWTVPLLPSLRQQARAAVQLLNQAPNGCASWLIDPSGWVSAAEAGRAIRWPAQPPAGASTICVVALAPATEVDRLRGEWAAKGLDLRMLVELAWLRPRPIEQPELDHRLVLPAPRALAAQAESHGQSIWFALGRSAANMTVEALARSGRVLQPESVVTQMRGLTGFEPVAQAPLVFSRQQTHGWAPQAWPASTPPSFQARGATQ